MSYHRHQSSLEAILDFSPAFSLTLDRRQAAEIFFNKLIDIYHPERISPKGYRPAGLIQAIFDRVAAKDAFLIFFFSFICDTLSQRTEDTIENDIMVYLADFDDISSWDSQKLSHVKAAIETFAEYIVENFLLPLRASSAKTPQPTPKSLSSMQSSTPVGTTQRLSALRQQCLVRDRHRCVVSQMFDRNEARKRFETHGDSFMDDDGKRMGSESRDRFQYLEVAHILPHSLTTLGSGETDISDSKQIAIRILDMFDPGIMHLLDGPKIDSPMNAITLTLDNHRSFGQFQIYFESTGVPHQYTIDSMERSPLLRDSLFPVTRTLTLSPNRTIDPASPRLLAIHGAIAHVMRISGAGEYIENILRDLEDFTVREDGSTSLGYMMGLRLGGWVDTLAVS